MKSLRNPLILVLAAIGFCAVTFGGWFLYRKHVADNQAKSAFSAPAATGVPDMYHDAPPPPQP